MFDQLESGKMSRLAKLAGPGAVVIAIGAMVVVPMLWPQTLPHEKLQPEPLRLPAMGRPSPPHVKVVEVRRSNGGSDPRRFAPPKAFLAPSSVPKTIPVIFEEPPEVDVYVPGTQNQSGQGTVCPSCPTLPESGGGGSVAVPPQAAPPEKPKLEEPKPPPVPVRVSSGVQQAKLIFQPRPPYPPLARAAHVQGTIRFTAIIGKDGRIQNLQFVSGHPLLQQAAFDAVKQWAYQPTMLNGEPSEVVTQIDVNFTLTQ